MEKAYAIWIDERNNDVSYVKLITLDKDNAKKKALEYSEQYARVWVAGYVLGTPIDSIFNGVPENVVQYEKPQNNGTQY